MARTPEQRAADDALAAAVEQVMSANGYTGRGLITTDFVVLVAQQGYADDGDGVSAMAWLLRDGEMPWHRIIGVVRAGLTRIEHVYNQEDS